MLSSPRSVVAALALVAGFCLFAGSLTGVAVAAHQFDDVPNTNAFHDAIGNVANAGITTGYADGTYRPGDPVTRGSMAGFLDRAGTRVGYGENTVNTTSNSDQTLVSIEMERGAESSTTNSMGFYVIIGNVQIETQSPSSCPCGARAYVNGVAPTYEVMTNIDDPSGRARTSMTTLSVIPAAPDDTAEFIQLRASINETTGNPSFKIDGQLAVLYVPFGHDGSQILQ